MYRSFFLRPGHNERIDADITLTPESYSSLHGVIRDADSKPVGGAVLLAFDDGAAVMQSISDENGTFVMGPLTPGRLYLIKVYKNDVKPREFEVFTE